MHPGIHLGLRVTARITFVFLAMAFAGEGAYRLWPGAATAWLARHRDHWTELVAASHSVHLALIVTLVHLVGFGFLHTGVIGWIVGSSLFGLIYLVALGAWLKRGPLYAAGFRATVFYILWTIFTLTFVFGTMRSPVYWPLALVAVGGLAIRIGGRFARSHVRAAAN